MRLASILLTAVLALCPGCIFGEPARDFDWSEDMVPGDLAHFRAKVPGKDGGQIVDHVYGLPIVLVPVILGGESAHADRVAEGGYHYHFEDRTALGLVLSYGDQVAKFDDHGRNLSYSATRRLLLGLLTSSNRSSRRLSDGSRIEASSYRFLTGVFGMDTAGPDTEYQLLWFIKFGDDLD